MGRRELIIREILRTTVLGVGPIALLAGCGQLLPSDEKIDKMGADFEARESAKIRQRTLGDNHDGFSSESDVDPQFDPREKREKRREAEAAGVYVDE